MRPEARAYFVSIMDLYLEGKDDAIRDIHGEVCCDHELYQDIWSHFSAPMRRRLKEIIGEMGSDF